MYNGGLVPPIPEEATIVGFADKVTVVEAAKHPTDLQIYATVRAVDFLEKAGLPWRMRKQKQDRYNEL